MNTQPTTCIIGFDSAWTDSQKAPGAVCALVISNEGTVSFKPPQLATFDLALEFIEAERRACGVCIVAIDQPTIVPNLTGLRPVDRVAGSLVSFVGGGVQPANRSKKKMFDDGAPIWRFMKLLDATQDPELCRTAKDGLFLIEVFPALALPAYETRFNGYRKGPKYNPGNRKKFHLPDWFDVLETVARYARNARIEDIEVWATELKHETAKRAPRKADQDLLDAVLCGLIGFHWRTAPRSASIMIGNHVSGYMIAPTDAPTRERLEKAATKCGVEVDGVL